MTSHKKDIQVFVIHVRGQKEREAFMEPQLKDLGFPYEYVLEGNMEDLTAEILAQNFSDNGQADTMYGVYPHTSCAYKQFLAYRRLLDSGAEGALIFEDDIRLFPHFKAFFLSSLEEIRREHRGEAMIANFEESSLLLVPRSKRRKGKYLYKATRDRFAGCYYISKEAARAIINFVEEKKCSLPVDRFHTQLVESGLINYYWNHPCLAVQCSCDGSMPTMIPTKPRPFKRLKWFYKRTYRHLLYWLR